MLLHWDLLAGSFCFAGAMLLTFSFRLFCSFKILLYLCRRERVSNDISGQWQHAGNFEILCIFLRRLFGQSK